MVRAARLPGGGDGAAISASPSYSEPLAYDTAGVFGHGGRHGLAGVAKLNVILLHRVLHYLLLIGILVGGCEVFVLILL
jgi:hypothetical protein